MSEENSSVVERAHITSSFRVSAFPLNKYKEWNADCEENFGNCRWMKMWHDHQAAKVLDKIVMRIDSLEQRIKKLEKGVMK